MYFTCVQQKGRRSISKFYNVTALFLCMVSSAADAINLIHYFSKEKLFLVFATDEEKH